jgi:hypothetical protein
MISTISQASIRSSGSRKLVFLRDFFGGGVIGIVKSYQLDPFDLFPVVQVKFAQMTYPKNSYFKHLSGFVCPQTYVKMVNRQGMMKGQL